MDVSGGSLMRTIPISTSGSDTAFVGCLRCPWKRDESWTYRCSCAIVTLHRKVAPIRCYHRQTLHRTTTRPLRVTITTHHTCGRNRIIAHHSVHLATYSSVGISLRWHANTCVSIIFPSIPFTSLLRLPTLLLLPLPLPLPLPRSS
jgi:hypothetical protein